jgi:20S proteasome alpha/beta subunit
MVAMSCGKSAVEAVKEAIKWDCFSGGKVKAYSFDNVKKIKKEENKDE